jgi:hypothetical protein
MISNISFGLPLGYDIYHLLFLTIKKDLNECAKTNNDAKKQKTSKQVLVD